MAVSKLHVMKFCSGMTSVPDPSSFGCSGPGRRRSWSHLAERTKGGAVMLTGLLLRHGSIPNLTAIGSLSS